MTPMRATGGLRRLTKQYDTVLFWNGYNRGRLLFQVISIALVGGVCGVSRTCSAALFETTCADAGG